MITLAIWCSSSHKVRTSELEILGRLIEGHTLIQQEGTADKIQILAEALNPSSDVLLAECLCILRWMQDHQAGPCLVMIKQIHWVAATSLRRACKTEGTWAWQGFLWRNITALCVSLLSGGGKERLLFHLQPNERRFRACCLSLE